MKTITVIDTPTFFKIAVEGAKHKFNRQVSQKFLDALDPNGIHIVTHSFVHNDIEIRAHVMAKMSAAFTDTPEEPVELYVDMTFQRFNSLNTVSVDR